VLLTLSPENTGFMAFQSRIFVLLKGNLLRNAIKSSVKVNDPLEALFEKTGEAFFIKLRLYNGGDGNQDAQLCFPNFPV
jgi:hypothetical protein